MLFTIEENISSAVLRMRVNDTARTYANKGSYKNSDGTTRELLDKDGDFAALVKADADDSRQVTSQSSANTVAMSLVDYRQRGEGAIKALQAEGLWDDAKGKPKHGEAKELHRLTGCSTREIDIGSYKFALLCRDFPLIAVAEGFSRRDYYKWGRKGNPKKLSGLRKVLEESNDDVKAFWSQQL